MATSSSFFSEFGLMWYLEELSKKEFMKFKELLKEEVEQRGLQKIPWAEVKKASREDLANLLMKHYKEKQAWDVTFGIFHKVNRQDLCDKAIREIGGYTKIYQAHIKKKFNDIWTREFFTVAYDIFDQKISEDERDYFEHFLSSKMTKKQHSRTLILKGIPGIGKTMVLTKLILAWSDGIIYQTKFSYVFYFCCQELKPLETTSLAELISREWPTKQVPIAQILSEPEKLLFLIDSFETLKCDLSQPQSELCSNWMEKRPIGVLLSSLLRKKMLPESSLIVTVASDDAGSLEHNLENPEVRSILGFNENSRKLYIRCMLQGTNPGVEAFHLIREQEQLFTMCRMPVLCWLVASCLRQEIERGRNLAETCRCTTSLFTSFILNLFTKDADCPTEESQSQLKGLCSLAVEGMWTNTIMFSKDDLRRNGIQDSDIPTLLDIKILRFRQYENHYAFLQTSVQEFFAAMFYLLRSHRDHPHPDVESVRLLLFLFLKREKPQWLFLGCFLFGLLHKREQEKMDLLFGFQLSQEIKQEFSQCLEAISEDRALEEQIDQLTLFYCLFEMQDEVFAQQAVNFLQEISLKISDNADLIICAYCLKHCTSLRKLSLSVEDVLLEDEGLTPVSTSKLICWHQVCSVLLINKNLRVLQVKESKLDEPASAILCDHLKQPSCLLQSLEINKVAFIYENWLFFEVFLSNSNLKHLNLNDTAMSHEDVRVLCNVLNHPNCNIEKLMLSGCKMSYEDCEVFASVLLSNRKLKHLNISYNHLDKGVPFLFSALCHPDCALKYLALANCHLSESCWENLSDVLLKNKTLSHLDISANDLKDEGLKILCEALRQPDSGIKSLRLEKCLITVSGCEDLALVLTTNQNLRNLQLSHNKFEDVGMKLLCEALVHPDCHLENLGLVACALTSACCEDLASVLTTSKTLWGINLMENALDYRGVFLLCKALKHPRCTLRVLGLRKYDFDEETQKLLEAEEERNPYLAIVSDF